jgi:hypothetical protein
MARVDNVQLQPAIEFFDASLKEYHRVKVIWIPAFAGMTVG